MSYVRSTVETFANRINQRKRFIERLKELDWDYNDVSNSFRKNGWALKINHNYHIVLSRIKERTEVVVDSIDDALAIIKETEQSVQAADQLMETMKKDKESVADNNTVNLRIHYDSKQISMENMAKQFDIDVKQKKHVESYLCSLNWYRSTSNIFLKDGWSLFVGKTYTVSKHGLNREFNLLDDALSFVEAVDKQS